MHTNPKTSRDPRETYLPWEDVQQYFYLNLGQLILDESQALAILDDKIVTILQSFNIKTLTEALDQERAFISERDRLFEERDKKISALKIRKDRDYMNDAESAIHQQFNPLFYALDEKKAACEKNLRAEIEKACQSPSFQKDHKEACDILSVFLHIPLSPGANPLSLADITNWENSFVSVEQMKFLMFRQEHHSRRTADSLVYDPSLIRKSLHLSELAKIAENCRSRATMYRDEPSTTAYCSYATLRSRSTSSTENLITDLVILTPYSLKVLQNSRLPNQKEISRLLSIGEKNLQSFQEATSVHPLELLETDLRAELGSIENSRGIFSQIYNMFSSIAKSSTAFTIGMAGMAPQLSLAWKTMIEGVSALPFNTASTASDPKNTTTANNNIAVLTALAAMGATIVAFNTLRAKREQPGPSPVALFSRKKPDASAIIADLVARKPDTQAKARKGRRKPY